MVADKSFWIGSNGSPSRPRRTSRRDVPTKKLASIREIRGLKFGRCAFAKLRRHRRKAPPRRNFGFVPSAPLCGSMSFACAQHAITVRPWINPAHGAVITIFACRFAAFAIGIHFCVAGKNRAAHLAQLYFNAVEQRVKFRVICGLTFPPPLQGGNNDGGRFTQGSRSAPTLG